VKGSNFERLRRRIHRGFEVPFLFVFSIGFASCGRDTGGFSMGGEYVESQTGLIVVDTLRVALSTVLLDSTVTSGTGRMLVGSCRDAVLGSVSGSACFRIGIPDSLDVLQDDVFDSVRLAVRYNGYFHGDTTAIQGITVHRLTGAIDPGDDGILISTDPVSMDPDPIGSLVYAPTPRGSDTLFIPIDDETGRTLFELLRDGAESAADNVSFLTVFPGLALAPEGSTEGAVIGFGASAVSDAGLILYASRNGLVRRTVRNTFPLLNPAVQYNRIESDWSLTALDALRSPGARLGSGDAGGVSFLQGGTGLAVRIDFPSLSELLLRDRGILMKALLSIAPLKDSDDGGPFPQELELYEADGRNRVTGEGTAAASAALHEDELVEAETDYVFDITRVLKDELADAYVDPDKGLLLELPASSMRSDFQRMIADAGNKNTRLRIYYLSY
jgi:hypothetical protein